MGLLGAFARRAVRRLPEPRDQAALDVLRATKRLVTGAPPPTPRRRRRRARKPRPVVAMTRR
ncbi:hypothetical protein, partial [Nocardioides sp.]|uniref:hypothetical protein n=1 Tax=Nocardioides sp. TaxID=35761 RepID=UPI002ED92411